MRSPEAKAASHGGQRLPWVTLGLLAVSGLLYAVLGPAPDLLVYDRAAVLDGQLWRLLTGHLVHLDGRHLAYNLGALGCLGYLYETAADGGSRRLLAAILGPAAIAVSGLLLLAAPATLFYCGLSALLNALYAAVAVSFWRQSGKAVWLLLIPAGLAKIAWEAMNGPIFSSGLVWPPHLGAHLAGLLSGSLYCLLAAYSEKKAAISSSRGASSRSGLEMASRRAA